MEPEGLSVSSMDPEDPWNMDTYEKEGDWSPPEANWNNSNEEWTAPVTLAKPQPTYFVSYDSVACFERHCCFVFIFYASLSTKSVETFSY